MPKIPAFLLLAALAALSGCQTTARQGAVAPQPEKAVETVRPEAPPAFPEGDGRTIGFLAPLSGEHGALGREFLDAAALALFDIGRDDLALVVADTGGGEGDRAARQVIAAGAGVVVGPLFARSVGEAAPVLRASGRRAFVFSSDPGVAQPGIFVMGHALENQVSRLVSRAAAAGHRRFAVLAPRSAHGERMAAALATAVRETGGLVTAEVFHDPAGSEIDDSVRMLVGSAGGPAAFDALFIPASGPLMQRIAAWLGHHGLEPGDVQLLGPGAWNDPALFREPVMEGAWFAMAPDAGRNAFLERFARIYGYDAVNPLTVAYDAMALAAALAYGGAGREVTDWRGFGGLDGPFRLNADGRTERLLAVMRITPEGPVVDDPAPAGFAARDDPGVS